MDVKLITTLADLIEEILTSTDVEGEEWYGKSIVSQNFYDRMSVAGYIFLGHGASRVAFSHELTPDVVYKFGYWESNATEANLWAIIPDEKRKFFSILHYSNGLVNVMERVQKTLQAELETRDSESVEYFELDRERLKAHIDLTKDGFYVNDNHLGNYGRREDKSIIMIDYGDDFGGEHFNSNESYEDFFKTLLGESRFKRVIRYQTITPIPLRSEEDLVNRVQFDSNIKLFIEEDRTEEIFFRMRVALKEYYKEPTNQTI